MTYYIIGIISIVATMIVQISIAQFIQIASVVPNLLVIPLVFFSFGLRLSKNILRGIFLGFVVGLSSGINSRLFWADVFSWTLTGLLLGLVSGPINRENPAVKSFLLFLCTFLQGMFFFIPLYISPFIPSPASFFWRLLLCSFYTTFLGTFVLWLTEKKKEEGILS